jgi:transcriptional regulator with XRE-family HTH domain|nr:MAG TPA: helix-turn-helix domain protein [Caudoviricetes sp.]
MTFGERLRQVIENKGITPYQLSAKTNVSQATLSRILANSTTKPSIKTVEVIADYLQISREWLLTGNGDMHTKSESDASFSDLLAVIASQQRTIENLSETIKNLTSKNL